MIDVKRPVMFDCRVAKLANCFPMIPSGKAHNEMLLGEDITDEEVGEGDRQGRQGAGVISTALLVFWPLRVDGWRRTPAFAAVTSRGTSTADIRSARIGRGPGPGFKGIADAAERIVRVHLAPCYGRHMLASKYTQGSRPVLRRTTCMTEVMTSIYSRIPAGNAEEIGRARRPAINWRVVCRQRVGAALTQYKMTEADGLALKKMIDQHGLPVFAKQTLPKTSE